MTKYKIKKEINRKYLVEIYIRRSRLGMFSYGNYWIQEISYMLYIINSKTNY